MLDRTNFQPDLTLRNAIRHVLASNEKNKDRHSAKTPVRPSDCRRCGSESNTDISPKELAILPPLLADKIARIQAASEDLQTSIDLMASREDLHAAVRNASRNLSDIESRGNAPFDTFISHNGPEHTSSKSVPILVASLYELPPVPLSSLPTSFR